MWRRDITIVLGAFVFAVVPVSLAQAQTVSAAVSTNVTQGVAPLAVFFDATNSSCSTCTQPFHDLHYEWDFADAASGSWTHSGKPKNKAYGPVAAHVFERPGTYPVQLTVLGRQGGTGTQTTSIKVEAPDAYWAGNRTVCFSTSGSFQGCPSGAVQQTTGDFAAAMSSCNATDRRCLFRRGETFTAHGSVTLTSTGPSMVGAFGSGEKPVVSFTQTSHALFTVNDGWRIVDLRFNGPGAEPSTVFAANGRVEDVLVLRTENTPDTLNMMVDFGGEHLDWNGADLHEGVFFVDNHWDALGLAAGYGMFIAARQLALLGNYIFDLSTGGQHNIRVQHAEEAVIAHNYLGLSHGMKHVLTIRSRDMHGSCSAGCGTPTRNIVVSDNHIQGNSAWPVLLTTANADGETPRGEDFLIERNFIEQSASHPKEMQAALKVQDTTRITANDNITVMDNWAYYNGFEFGGGSAIGVSYVAANNNSCYSKDSPSDMIECVRFLYGSASTSRAYNNLGYFPNASWVTLIDGEGSLAASGNNILAGSNPFVSAQPKDPLDFKLGASSVAVDAGTPAAGVLIDFLELARPAGAGIDAGALERDAETQGPQAPLPPTLLAPMLP